MGRKLCIEILRKSRSQLPCKSMLGLSEITEAVKKELKEKGKLVTNTKLTTFVNNTVQEQVQTIHICEAEDTSNQNGIAVLEKSMYDFEDVTLDIYTYQLDTEGPQVGLIGTTDGEQPGCHHWILPSLDFEGLWENLIYDSNIKETLLNYMKTIMFFSEYQVNENVITWNRLVLLHGPPGTGKTSLCKALAQKLTVRLGKRFRYGELIEINSHSLFSKYFSESGKLVMQMFETIKEHVMDENALVFVLIDEVESLTLSRQNSLTGSEPSDSVRVVNTILTQLDKLKKYPNVLVLTTSNITGALDSAFIDRADIKQYIGLPSKHGIYSIYKSCIDELSSKNVISAHKPMLEVSEIIITFDSSKDDCCKNSLKLLNISELSEGLSGRSLRKIPFLTYAHFIKTRCVSVEHFLECLQFAVIKFKDENLTEINSH